jgi:hypothetical protein
MGSIVKSVNLADFRSGYGSQDQSRPGSVITNFMAGVSSMILGICSSAPPTSSYARSKTSCWTSTDRRV